MPATSATAVRAIWLQETAKVATTEVAAPEIATSNFSTARVASEVGTTVFARAVATRARVVEAAIHRGLEVLLGYHAPQEEPGEGIHKVVAGESAFVRARGRSGAHAGEDALHRAGRADLQLCG